MRTGQDRVKLIKSNPLYNLGDDAKVGIVASTGWKSSVVGDREVVFVATTEDVDEHDEVVVASGSQDNSYFHKVRSVMLDHEHSFGYLVGKARHPKKQLDHTTGRHKGWVVRVDIVKTPLGDDVLSIAREHGIGCSIGFEALNYRPAEQADKDLYGKKANGIIDKWSWIELSITAMPANASCRSMNDGVHSYQTTNDGVSKSLCDLDRMCVKGLIRPETAYMLGMPRPKKRIILLA